jgi:hypothetical protein
VVSLITASGAAITWTTDKPSDSQVEYGPTTSYGRRAVLDPSLVTAHVVTLSGLAAGTPYHYRVKSKDVAANMAVSLDFAFTTGVVSTDPPPTPAPPAAPTSLADSGGPPRSGGGVAPAGGAAGGGSPSGGGGFAPVQIPGSPSGGLASAGYGAPRAAQPLTPSRVFQVSLVSRPQASPRWSSGVAS